MSEEVTTQEVDEVMAASEQRQANENAEPDTEVVKTIQDILFDKPMYKVERIDFEEEKQKIQLQKAALVATEQTSFFNPVVYGQMKQMATDFIASKAVPRGIENAEQLIMVFQAGFEMGMKPVEAMNSLYIVNGKITTWGPAVVRRLRSFGWVISYEETDTSCKATVTNGKETYTEEFTFEMAEKSGYTKDRSGNLKVGWIAGANRKLKLRYGAISNIIKSYIPEVLGLYAGVAELELDALPEQNNKEKVNEAIERRAKRLDGTFVPQPADVITD